MDHRDGNPDNNTEENLRLICPNCHALTPTHCGRNKGKAPDERSRRRRLAYHAGRALEKAASDC